MNESLVRHNSKFNFSPFFFLQFHAAPSLFLSLFLFLQLSILSKLLIQGSSWWWSSFFHGLFLSGWCLLSPLLLCLPLHLHGGKSPLKDLIEAQRSNLHRSSTSKLPSPCPCCGGVSMSLWLWMSFYPLLWWTLSMTWRGC